MNDSWIAWVDLHQVNRWINENASNYLTEESNPMLTAAEITVKIFDWSMLKEDQDLACYLLDRTIWYYALSSVLGTAFGWDSGHSWLPDFIRQLQWESPWVVSWYDTSRPLAARHDRRLLWTWLMQKRMVEHFPELLETGQEAQEVLSEYLRLSHPEDCVPPTNLDCILEIWVTSTRQGEVIPTRLIYRKLTLLEIRDGISGVIIEWR